MTIQLKGFRAISSEVTFIDMQPRNGDFEPLVGFIVLEQSGASVDMEKHRLVPLKYYLK